MHTTICLTFLLSRNCQIIIAEVDMFDFSEGEPPQGYLTILRALEVRLHRIS